MLRGEYQYALDDKGRVVIPPKFRRALGDQVVATRWIDPCISVHSPAEWTKVEEALRRLPTSKRAVVRFLLAGAADLDLDRQGRITLPQHLREYAEIDREVVVIGLSSRVEIWSRSTWQTYLKKAQRSAPEIADQLEGLSL